MVGDNYYELKMDFDGLVEVQEACLLNGQEVGPQFVLNRLRELEATGGGFQSVGRWNPMWVYEVLRIALVRGGLEPRKAIKLCDRYIREGFVMDYIDTAADALFVGLYGPDDEPVETPGETMTEATSPTPSDESNGASSMSSPDQSD